MNLKCVLQVVGAEVGIVAAAVVVVTVWGRWMMRRGWVDGSEWTPYRPTERKRP
jgi:hypothetical protein